MLCSAYVYAQYDRNKNEELSQDILTSMIIEQENIIQEDTTTISKDNEVWVIDLQATSEDDYEPKVSVTEIKTSSTEKETKNNLKALLKLNESSIGLIRAKCMNKKIPNKTTLLIVSNLIRENIEVTDENREIYWIQMQITDISNFILNYLDVHDFSGQAKDNLIRIIEHENACEDYNDIYEKIMFYSTEYVVNILDREKELFEDI